MQGRCYDGYDIRNRQDRRRNQGRARSETCAAQSGQFYGPGLGPMAIKGEAKPYGLEEFYNNPETRDLLWETSCKAIGQDFAL